MSVSQPQSKPQEQSEGPSLMDRIRQNMELLSEKAGIDAKIVLLVLGAACFFVFIGYFDYYITNIIGIIYPAFWSIRAIESKESDDDKQWLTYWVVFSLFSILDLFSGFILKFIPFYFFFKILFLIWLFLPNFRGATRVYDLVLIKLFRKYESALTEAHNNLMNKAGEMIQTGKTVIKENQNKIVQAALDAADKVKTG